MKVLRLTKGGALHALKIMHRGAYQVYNYKASPTTVTNVPARDVYWCSHPSLDIGVDDPRIEDGEPTCKVCRKSLELDGVPEASCVRYVIVEDETNRYVKDPHAWPKPKTTPHVLDAKLYKNRKVAGNAIRRKGFSVREVCAVVED